MDFKDYYATLGVARDAAAGDIKKAFRKLARKFHPDVSKEPDAEARMKEINEANEVLSDPDKRAAYDQAGRGQRAGQAFHPPPDWDAGFEFAGAGRDGRYGRGAHGQGTFGQSGFGQDADHSAFFEELFGRMAREQPRGRGFGARAHDGRGEDHHAKVLLDVEDAWGGAARQISLRVPQLDAQGRLVLTTRTLNVRIPKGVRAGQLIRLAGQGAPGFDATAAARTAQRAAGGGAEHSGDQHADHSGGAAAEVKAGDLLLEVQFRPHPRFHLDGSDLSMALPAAPWECALGANLPVTLPDGSQIEVRVPEGAQSGTQLRVRGKGLPAEPPGDLLLRMEVRLPPANTPRARELYETMARELAFDARAAQGV